MLKFYSSHQYVTDNQGFELAFVGMVIVFTVLATLSLFIALMPRILAVINRFIPEQIHHNTLPSNKHKSSAESATVAAISYALHQSKNK